MLWTLFGFLAFAGLFVLADSLYFGSLRPTLAGQVLCSVVVMFCPDSATNLSWFYHFYEKPLKLDDTRKLLDLSNWSRLSFDGNGFTVTPWNSLYYNMQTENLST